MRQKPIEIDIQSARSQFSYDPNTGELWWIGGARFNRRIGQRAGYVAGGRSGGYWKVKLDGHLLKASRIAWAMYYGEQPPPMVDHINGDRSDDRIANLRAADFRQNAANAKLISTNKSGHRGVRVVGKKWRAEITRHKRRLYLGEFPTKGEAIAAYRRAARKEFGEYARVD